MAHTSVETDPCGVDGRYHRQAYVWFVCVVIIAALLTFYLARIDRWMFDTNARYLDDAKYRENRLGATSVASEDIDHRKYGDLRSAEAAIAHE